MLRHLATEVGDEWRQLAQCLGIRSIRQQAVIRKINAAAAASHGHRWPWISKHDARRDAVTDMLTSWVKKMPRSADKVMRVKKGKGFPYSIPSVGPGAGPGVQAVSLQVTVSHPPGGRLPLLSARPPVTW